MTLAHPGAVTAIQRSSSHLALNIHFHSLVTEGVFVQEDPGGPAIFHELPPPTDEEIAQVASEVCTRTIALLKRKGRWHDDPEQDNEDRLAATEPAVAEAYQASVRGVLSMGPGRGQRVVRFFGAAANRDGDDSPKRPGGFDLYARQATFSHDRERVEKLARYILRPPLAQNNLERLADGRVMLRLKHAWRDGTWTGMPPLGVGSEALMWGTPDRCDLRSSRPHEQTNCTYSPSENERHKVPRSLCSQCESALPGCSS